MLTVLQISIVGAVDAGALSKFFWAKLDRFEQICLDLGEIWAKLRRNLGKGD